MLNGHDLPQGLILTTRQKKLRKANNMLTDRKLSKA